MQRLSPLEPLAKAPAWPLSPFVQGLRLPLLMGILNVTPDSFSDGGSFLDPEKAIAQAFKIKEDGADILDIGAESTRPGSFSISLDEELRRLLPVLERLWKEHYPLPISVDTTKAEVALEAIQRGASIINDVSALRWDSSMGRALAKTGASVILMHAQARPNRMQSLAHYHNITRTVYHFLHNRIAYAMALGIAKGRLMVDPGIGFGKRAQDNLTLLGELGGFCRLGVPIVVGLSRKRFLNTLTASPSDIEEKDRLSAILGVQAWQKGASILRVHNVRKTIETLRSWGMAPCSA